jgi:hypothetical protein
MNKPVEEEAFLYTVHPRKCITGLSGCGIIRTPKSLFLTKEDVKICLQRASVYRRFAGAEEYNERVTIGNLDRLHRAEHISEDDWKEFLSKEMSEGHGKVESNTPEKSLQEKEPEKLTEVESDDDEFIEKVNLEESAPVIEEVAENTVESTDEVEAVEEEAANESEDQVQAEPTTVEEESEESVSHKANQNNANREFKSNNRKNKK